MQSFVFHSQSYQADKVVDRRRKVINYKANLSKVEKSLKQTPWTRSLFVVKKHCVVTLEGLLQDDLARRNRGTQADGLIWELNHASFAFLTQSGTCAVNPTCTALIYSQRTCEKDNYISYFRQSRGDTDLAQNRTSKAPLLPLPFLDFAGVYLPKK